MGAPCRSLQGWKIYNGSYSVAPDAESQVGQTRNGLAYRHRSRSLSPRWHEIYEPGLRYHGTRFDALPSIYRRFIGASEGTLREDDRRNAVVDSGSANWRFWRPEDIPVGTSRNPLSSWYGSSDESPSNGDATSSDGSLPNTFG